MRCVYIGNFKPSHSTENHIAVSLEALGVNVLRLQEDAIASDPGVLTEFDVDLLLYTRTWDCLPEGWRAVLANPPEGTISAAVHLDIFHGLNRDHEVREQAMFTAQHVFTADGDHEDEWERLGINHHWLPPGVVDLSLVGETLGTPRPDLWPYDVAFVGSYGYHAEWPARPAIIDALRAEFGDRFIHVGGDGDLLPDGTRRRVVEQELNDLYATVPVIAGDSLGAHLESRYWSDRFPEVWGRGGFLIFPYISALRDRVGDYPGYDGGSVEQAVTRCMVALDNESERNYYLRELGQRVRTTETYTQRMVTLLQTIGLEP